MGLRQRLRAVFVRRASKCVNRGQERECIDICLGKDHFQNNGRGAVARTKGARNG